MPIRFVCSTIVRFDPDTKQYIRCQSALSVDESLVGTFIVCPECRQRVTVPQLSDSRLASSDPPERKLAARAPETTPASPLAGTTPSSTQPAATTESAEPSSLPFSSFAATRRCKRCGGNLDSARRCVNCGYQATLQATAVEIDPQTIQLAGFQRWLARFVQQGNAGAVLTAIHALVGLVLVIMVVMGFVGGGLGLAVAICAAGALLAAYVYLLYDCRRIARGPSARLSWWQRAGWNAILAICRASRWKFLGETTPFRVLDLRRESLTEQQLLSRGDLVDYEVLDAAGVPITDAGLSRMKGLRRLRRLVICGSQTSPEAVFRLQQDLPDTWIWT